MPSIAVNSANINTFSFNVTFDIKNQTVLFDASASSYYGSSGAGIFAAKICFSLVDSSGIELMGVDFANPQITPSVNQQYTLDLSSLALPFLFQGYKIVGYIQDTSTNNIYQTLPVVKTVCQPVNITESGYVPGEFQLIPDCVNNVLTVKELTVLAYNNQLPESVSKDGNLYYPTGTIAAVPFDSTPFSNNELFTGQYAIACTTVGTYNLGDGVYVLVTYFSNSNFDVTCTSRVADLLCCIKGVQDTAIKFCNDARGQKARQQLLEISPFLSTGLLSEINGQDASFEADYIKKALNCSCGATSIHQNEVTPINPSIYNIVLTGVGGTTVDTPVVTGSTKTFRIKSNTYVVAKGYAGDLAFTINIDTSVTNTVKYLITFDYSVMAGYIINAIQNNPVYIAALQNVLVTALDLSGLDGKCIINTSTANYTLQLNNINSSDLVASITINGIIHNAPANTHANDAAAVQTWLNTLTLGTFAVTFNAGVISVTSNTNPNVLSTIAFAIGGVGGQKVSILFQSSNYTLIQILQAIINYLCALTAGQVALGSPLTLSYVDYNGNTIIQNFVSTDTQASYNSALSSFINSLALTVQNMIVLTCAKIKSFFVDRPNNAFTTSDRILGTTGGGDCTGLTDQQIALVVISAINKYADVKTAYCAIDCGSPATCPEVVNTSLAVVGSSIAFYGLTWNIAPLASQFVTVRYKLTSSGTWLLATNALLILPNGNISGTTPFIVLPSAVAGQLYDVMVINNCGGVGFSKQIQIPSSSVYTNNYKLENALYLICGVGNRVLYSSAPFGTGVTLYADIALTIPITGYHYVTLSGYNIFNLNSATGVVGVDTLSACTSGTAGKYRLNNALGAICGVSDVDLYTNGAFAVGGIIYTDIALTTPVTGYAYIEPTNTQFIYNLNNATGQIQASTGLQC